MVVDYTQCFIVTYYYNLQSPLLLDLTKDEIEGDMEEYAINYIADVKIDNWPRRRGLYLQFLTYFINFDTP